MNEQTIELGEISNVLDLETSSELADKIKEGERATTFLVVGPYGSVSQSAIRAMLLRHKPDANVVFTVEEPRLHKTDILGSLSEKFACALRDMPEPCSFYETTVQDQAGYSANSFQSMNPNLQKLNPKGKSIIGSSNKRRKGKRN